MTNSYYPKHKEKLQKEARKDIKIVLKKKKKKSISILMDVTRTFLRNKSKSKLNI